MKKVILLLILVIVMTGCQNKKKLESEMKKATNIYYEKYIYNQVTGLDTLEITLGDLRELKSSKIDLSKLDKCSDDTKVSADIKNNKIVNYDISLKCH